MIYGGVFASLRAVRGLKLSCIAVVMALSGCKSAPPPAEKPAEAPASQPAAETGPKVETVSLASVGLSAEALDRSADPCTDFYQFACGGWLKATEIPSDRARWVRSFSEINKRNEDDLKKILEDSHKGCKNGCDDPIMAELGAFYGACMDEAGADKTGIDPLKPLLKKVSKVRNAKTLAPVLAELHLNRIWAFFDLSATQDFKDATKVIGYVDHAGLGLPDRDYYLSEDKKKVEARTKYQAHIEAMFVTSGLMKAKAAKKAAADVMKLEVELAKLSKSRVERRDPESMYHRLNREGLIKLAPSFPWAVYFKNLGYGELSDLNITAPKFFEGMNGLLKKTKKTQLQNYLKWHILHGTAPYLSKSLVDENFKLAQVLTGQPEQRPRWKRCISAVTHALGDLLAQPYVQLRFAGNSKEAAERYVKEISEAFGRNLNTLDWMDDKTKGRAREKLGSFEHLIGYPAEWKKYGFKVTEVYGANMMASHKFETARDLDRIGKPVDRQRWEMPAPIVNAYYHPLKNHMVFPAGILQPPFYSVNASIPVNLGAMGMVVGHELTHGFDDKGSQFDKDGNLKSWWEPETRKAFEKRTQCVVDQYSNYEVLPGVKLNGKLTLGENIADLGGMKLAFSAYRNMRKDAGSVRVAEGFSEDQQFFLATGQIWCAKTRDAMARMRATTDTHSAPRYRVNGPLSNLKEFSEAFQCKKGTVMNPENTCSVW